MNKCILTCVFGYNCDLQQMVDFWGWRSQRLACPRCWWISWPSPLLLSVGFLPYRKYQGPGSHSTTERTGLNLNVQVNINNSSFPYRSKFFWFLQQPHFLWNADPWFDKFHEYFLVFPLTPEENPWCRMSQELASFAENKVKSSIYTNSCRIYILTN